VACSLDCARSIKTRASRNVTLFVFNLVVLARFMLTLFVVIERRIPWEEAASVPMAFALYLLGFPLLARPGAVPFGWLELVGIALFVIGSFVNTFAELSRKRWKARPENRGKLYTGGLFSVSMHPNYFGDLLWVSGYACVTHSPYAALIPAFLFVFFYFYNVPKLDAYLGQHYGESFRAYERRTKRLIPFVL
jgi:steroid 5-alpha reductase family enzyme